MFEKNNRVDAYRIMEFTLFNKYAEEDLSGFSIRDIKYARSRLSILNAFTSSMVDTPYEEIRIKDICRMAEISEPSFYNYFAQKDDLFLYFIGFWSIDVQLFASVKRPGLEAIEAIYLYTAEQIVRMPSLMKEIIAYHARINTTERAGNVPPVTRAEKAVVFGAVPDVERLSDRGLAPILTANLVKARENGEIGPHIDIELLSLALASIFFGLPILLIHQTPRSLPDYYSAILKMMFEGTRIK